MLWLRWPHSALEAFKEKYPMAETATYFAVWYFLNVQFNILNKQVYNYFPYPWYVILPSPSNRAARYPCAPMRGEVRLHDTGDLWGLGAGLCRAFIWRRV